MIKVLNLYAGIGGNRKLWPGNVEVTAVEINPDVAKVYKENFPQDIMIIGDAHQYLLDHYDKFDFIWSSPPCSTHSTLSRVNKAHYDLRIYPDMRLYQEIIYLKQYCKKPFVVENVKPYYMPLIHGKELGRHLFWSNFPISEIRLPLADSIIDMKKDELLAFLGLKYSKNVYLNNNHDERQILRNCVHPKIGLHVFNAAFKDKQKVINDFHVTPPKAKEGKT